MFRNEAGTGWLDRWRVAGGREGGGGPDYDLILEGSIKWFVYPSCGAGELEPGQLWVKVLFIIFPPVRSHERRLETVAARRPGGAKGRRWGTSSTLKASPLARGIRINKACPTPAPGSTMETPRANGDAGRDQLLEAPTNEMDYINPFCCSSSCSLNIELTDSTSN